jgi:hypothetical protein
MFTAAEAGVPTDNGAGVPTDNGAVAARVQRPQVMRDEWWRAGILPVASGYGPLVERRGSSAVMATQNGAAVVMAEM